MLFGAGFYSLGVPFSARVYPSEMAAGVKVDDMFEKVKVDDVRKMEDVDRNIAIVIAMFLTDLQKDALLGWDPLIARKSDSHNGFCVEYTVWNT